LRSSSQKPVPILTFHKVDPSFEWGVTRIAPSGFRKILQFLKNEGYESISLQTLRDPTAILPPKPVVFTFDDSYESVYTGAYPLMQEYDFFGTVFVITGYAGRMNEWDVNLGWKKFRHLSWDQIRLMKKGGFEIGSHTVHHPDLTRIDSRLLYFELNRSKKEIEDKIGEEALFISFPFGRYNTRVIDASKSCGYQNGCGFWLSKQEKKLKEKFVLERKAYYLFDGLWNLKAKLEKNRWTFFENMKLRIVNFCSHGSSLIKPAEIKFK
jgi:peptidoglycan/xylan/chitin deacetylase (PgdA/CDA1 family)